MTLPFSSNPVPDEGVPPAMSQPSRRPLGAVVSMLRAAGERTGLSRNGGFGAPPGLIVSLGCVVSVLAVAAAPAYADSCPNAQLRTGYSANLPDCRAYEQVTPTNKDNSDPFVTGVPTGSPGGFEASVAGDRFAYTSIYRYPDTQAYGPSYLATRGTSWASQSVSVPQSVNLATLCNFNSMVAYTPDLSKGIFQDGRSQPGCGTDDPPIVAGEPEGVQNLFLRDNATGTYRLLSPNPVTGSPGDAIFDGASSDLSHVIFEDSAQLTADAPAAGPGQTNLYESDGGAVSLVTQVPSAPATSCTGAACTAVIGQLAASGLSGAHLAAENMISRDASRVYFNANGNLYLREGGVSTVQIDAPAAGAPGPGGGGQFMAAGADGSKAFFTDDASAGLTADTVSGSGPNLYEYDVPTGTLTDITPVGDPEVQICPSGLGQNVPGCGFSGISDDGSYLYFVADGSLAPGATAGQPNLYLWHGGTMTLVATLSSGDVNDWGNTAPNLYLSARVSPSGRYLVFQSVKSLTGYDNHDASTGNPDIELFRYDASAGSLACVSCLPSGAAPTADTTIDAPQTSGYTSFVYLLPRTVIDTGQVFFDTREALVPADTNGVNDVYEYEDGQPRLLSGGTDPADSLFLDATPDGSNVFFGTRQQLAAGDGDGAYDVYDARVGGGFPQPPVTACTGESCKPPPASAPPPPTSASVTFAGPGNATSATTTAKVKLLRRVVRGDRIELTLRVPAAGRIVVTGSGVQREARSFAHGGNYAVVVRLTSGAKRTLKRRHQLKLAIEVGYQPTSAGASTATVKLTVKARRPR